MSKTMKANFAKKNCVLLCILCPVLIMGIYFCARSASEVSTVSPDITLYYRGLNIVESDNFFGKMYYKIVVSEGNLGYWVTSFRSVGINRYKGFYADGTLKEEGEIVVEHFGSPLQPLPDRHNVWNGKYYKPDGTLGASIIQGTGMQKLWYPNGDLMFELELLNGARVRAKAYTENGTIISDVVYVKGQEVDAMDQ